MADTRVTTYNHFRVDLVAIKVVKGNELTDLITETFDGKDFADSKWAPDVAPMADVAQTHTEICEEHGLSRSRDLNRAVRVSKQIAALGARGDYIEFVVEGAEVGTIVDAQMKRNFMVEALDFSGVPVAVQHAIFGKYSPFLTPTQPVSRGMIKGVDRQKIELIANMTHAADDTYASGSIRGVSTSRWQGKVDVYATPTKFTFKAKPAGDGVFVIPRGAMIWAGKGSDAERIVTYVT